MFQQQLGLKSDLQTAELIINMTNDSTKSPWQTNVLLSSVTLHLLISLAYVHLQRLRAHSNLSVKVSSQFKTRRNKKVLQYFSLTHDGATCVTCMMCEFRNLAARTC